MRDRQGQELQNENTRLRNLLVQAGIDAATSDVADKLQKLLIAELHHRVKNLLSMVLSITSQTLRSARTIEAAGEAIQNRILILSRSFDLLIDCEMDALPLQAIIENAAEPYNATGRIRIVVPRVEVEALPALSIALVINELSTNATKYGALWPGGGTVAISGDFEGDMFSLVWTETGGPPVEPPSWKSFGIRMIESVIPEATVDLDFQPSGLVARIRMPRAALTPTSSSSYRLV